MFDINRHARTGRSAECKQCRRQRQARGGYGTSRNRALRELARQHPEEYQRYRQQARRELAPGTATAKVWDQARGRALAELARRHRAEWDQHYRQVRTAHPDWTAVQASNAATARQRRAERLLQLAHPAEYQALYAAERAKLTSPTQRPGLPQGGLAG